MSDTVGVRKKISGIVNSIGLPTIIIAAFWLFIIVIAFVRKMAVVPLISDTVRRFGMNGILVLAMVPSIQSGTGPNFALPLGILCGLFSMVFAIEIGTIGVVWLLVSAGGAVILGLLVGYFYGRLLNAVKGSEMTIATYTGFSAVALLCLVWLTIPFHSPKMKWFMGEGLRETIQLDAVKGGQILNNLWRFTIGDFVFPTGMMLVMFAAVFFVWLFFKSRTGIAISAGGINPVFARASGLNHDNNRIKANILSTVLGALGIIVYSQSYGYAQIYLGPLYMAFDAVAAVLIGGATASRAKVSHVLIGTFLFQGLMTSALPVANDMFVGLDLSETLRMIVQNGIILYALTQVKGARK